MVMALLATGALGAAGVAADDPAVAGAGFGTLSDAFGVCADQPFVAQVVYLPQGKGLATWQFGANPACPTAVSGGLVFGTVHVGTNPPAQVNYFCSGDSLNGLFCSGESVTVRVGPYPGPGSMVSFDVVSDDYRLVGRFLAG